jgi:hypothetical protein
MYPKVKKKSKKSRENSENHTPIDKQVSINEKLPKDFYQLAVLLSFTECP